MGRGPVALVALLVLAGLCAYSLLRCPLRPIGDHLADPDRYDGAVVQVTGRLEEVGEAGFTIRDPADNSRVRVMPRPDAPEVRTGDCGSRVTVVGTFHPAGRVEGAEVYVARGRDRKIYVSLLPLLFVGILLALRFRLRLSRLAVEERADA